MTSLRKKTPLEVNRHLMALRAVGHQHPHSNSPKRNIEVVVNLHAARTTSKQRLLEEGAKRCSPSSFEIFLPAEPQRSKRQTYLGFLS
jgi:hypothetical protein